MHFLDRWRQVLALVMMVGLYLSYGCTATDSETGNGSEVQTAQLDVSVEPSEGGETSLSSATYEVGQELELEATPNEGWQFTEWKGDTSSTDNPLIFTLERDMSLSAVFTELEPDQYPLTVNANPSEGGSVDPASGTFEEGTEVQVEATPKQGWNFTGWSGDLNADQNPVTITMDSTIELSANFEAIMVDLSVAADPSEGGSVDPASGTFQYGEEVQVTATPNEGWEFVEWTGDRTSTDNSLTIIMDGDVNLTAVFSEIPRYELTVNAAPAEGGSVDPTGGTYLEGTEVEVSASPNKHWAFVEWTGDISSTSNSETITINSNIGITANFAQTASAFLDSVEVTDTQNSTYLCFGMKEGASSGFDDFDNDAPPRPPQGSFYAELLIENYSLFKDIRPISSNQVVWELSFAPAEGQSPVTIRWEFAESRHIGELRLVDDPQNPTVDIDMKSQTSHEVSSSVNTLYIISN